MTKNNIWFVTGASKGLGLALVKKLLSENYKVVATSRNLEDLYEAIGKENEDFLPLQVDLVDERSVEQAIEKTVERFGAIDVIVNNAGYNQTGPLEAVTDKEARENFDINVFGVLNVIRNVLPYLRKQQSGYIINLSSMAGYRGFVGSGIYSATKFAVDGLSEALAAEVKDFGIKVTSVKPGFFRTNFLKPTSMATASKQIDAYEEMRKAHAARLKEKDGEQEGNPEAAAEIFIALSKEEKPPLHLFLGADAYETAYRKIERVKRDLEDWKEIATSTDY